MAAPTFVDAGTVGTTGTSAANAPISFSGTNPGDIVGETTNDYAFVFLYKESTAAVTAPGGWDALGTADQDTGGFKYRVHVYGRRIDGTEVNPTWSWTGSTWRYAECVVYQNAITTEAPAVVVTFDEETAQNTTPTHPGITITRSNSGLVYVIFNFSDIDNTTPPTGFTHRSSTGATGRNVLMYDDLSTTTGASGTVTQTLSGDIEYPLTVLIELATEAAAGGGTKAKPPMRRPWRIWNRRVG
jgi:hypothetical protein